MIAFTSHKYEGRGKIFSRVRFYAGQFITKDFLEEKLQFSLIFFRKQALINGWSPWKSIYLNRPAVFYYKEVCWSRLWETTRNNCWASKYFRLHFRFFFKPFATVSQEFSLQLINQSKGENFFYRAKMWQIEYSPLKPNAFVFRADPFGSRDSIFSCPISSSVWLLNQRTVSKWKEIIVTDGGAKCQQLVMLSRSCLCLFV